MNVKRDFWTTGRIWSVVGVVVLLVLIYLLLRTFGLFGGWQATAPTPVPTTSAPAPASSSVVSSAPSLKSFKADRTKITAGESVTISWECETGVPLIAGGDLDPEKIRQSSGSETIEFPDPGTFRFFAICVEQVAGKPIVITVDPVPPPVARAPDPVPTSAPAPALAPAPAPTPTPTPDPPIIVWGTSRRISVPYGRELLLSWGTTGATNCTRKGAWSGSAPLSGSQNVGPLQGPTTWVFGLTCVGPGGPTTSAVTVVVGASPPPPPAPVVIIPPPAPAPAAAPAPAPAPAVKTFTASATNFTAGESVIFNWECDYSQKGRLSGNPVIDPEKDRGISGSESVVFPISGTFNITATCVAGGRQTSRSVTITVTDITPVLTPTTATVLTAWRKDAPLSSGGIQIWATSTVAQNHRFLVRCNTAQAYQDANVAEAGVQQLLYSCLGVVNPEVRLEQLVGNVWTHIQTVRP